MKKLLFLLLLLPFLGFGQSTKISDMTAATTLSGTELVPIVQTTNKKATASLFFDELGNARYPLLLGSYSNPSWITSLAWSKISGTPTTIAGYGITDFNSLGDARWPLLSGSYTNPSWIVSLPWSKVTATPTTLSGYGITDGIYTAGSGLTLTGNSFSLGGNMGIANTLLYDSVGYSFAYRNWEPSSATGTLTFEMLNDGGNIMRQYMDVGTFRIESNLLGNSFRIDDGVEEVKIGVAGNPDGTPGKGFHYDGFSDYTWLGNGSRNLRFTGSTTILNIGSDASQDIYKRGSGGTIERIPVGSEGDVLTVSGGVVGWSPGLTLSDGSGTTANGSSVDLGGLLSSDANVLSDGTLSVNLGSVTEKLNNFKVFTDNQLQLSVSNGIDSTLFVMSPDNFSWTSTYNHSLASSPAGLAVLVGGDATGDILYNDAGYLDNLAIGSSGAFMRAQSGLPTWSSLTIPNTISANSILVANSANTLVELTPTASQSIRRNSGNTAWEAYTPAAGGATSLDGLSDVIITSASVNKVLQHNGTDWVDQYMVFPVSVPTITANNYTLVASDHGKTLHINNGATAVTLTIPTSLATNFQCSIINKGTNTVTLTPSGTTLESEGTTIVTQHTGATVYHHGSNVWTALGSLGTPLVGFTDELVQDAVGGMVDASLTYIDGTPLLQRAALTGAITATAGSNATSLGSFTVGALSTAISDADISGTNTGDQSISVTGTTTATIDLSGDASDATITGAGISAVSVSGNSITVTSTEVDGSISNEGSLTVGAGTGTTSIINSNTSGSTGVTITAGTGIGIAEAGNVITLTNSGIITEVDGSVSNELQTITNSSDATSHTVTLSNSGGTVQFIEGSNITLTTGGTGSAGTLTIASTGGGVSDGDKGDITVSGSGATWNIDAATIGLTELSATGTPSSSTYLRGDNTWASVSGSGDVSKVGTPVDNQVGVWTGDGTIEGDADFTYDGATLTLAASTAVWPLRINATGSAATARFDVSGSAGSGLIIVGANSTNFNVLNNMTLARKMVGASASGVFQDEVTVGTTATAAAGLGYSNSIYLEDAGGSDNLAVQHEDTWETVGTMAKHTLKLKNSAGVPVQMMTVVDSELKTHRGANTGIVSSEHFIMQNADYTLTAATGDQKIFNATTNGRLTLDAGTYFFDAILYLTTMSATSGNAYFDILGGGTATVSKTLYHGVGLDNTTPTNATTQTGSFTVTAQSVNAIVSAGTGTGMGVHISGMFRVSVAGTIIPSIGLLTANAAVVKDGTYFTCRRVGTSSVTNVGQWD